VADSFRSVAPIMVWVVKNTGKLRGNPRAEEMQ
jgi:hypothetical protein